MPSIILAGSSPEETGFINVVPTTNAAWLDAQYTILGMVTDGESSGSILIMLPAPTNEVWYRFRWRSNGAASGPGGSSIVFRALDGAQATIGEVVGTGNQTAVARSHGDSQISGNTYAFSTSSGAFMFGDVQVLVSDTTITVRFYVDGSLFSEAVAIDTAGPRDIAYIRLRMIARSDTVSGRASMSELIVTDGIPTIGWRLSQRRPAAPGALSQMQGSWADLVNPDPGAAVVGNADGQRMSWEPSAYLGAASPANIVAVIGNVQTSRMAGTPTRVNQFLRLDGSNYDAPPKNTNVLKRDQDIWWVNPATGQPWVTADFADMEVGIRVTD